MNIATQSKQLVFGCLVATLLARTVCVGAVIFSQGHVHPEVHRNVNELEVAVHDHDNDEEYEADEVLFFVTDAHKTTVPSNPLFSFLGSPGSPVWITPQTQQSGKLFMGLGASELNASDWLSPITIELVGFSGPGNFSSTKRTASATPRSICAPMMGCHRRTRFRFLRGAMIIGTLRSPSRGNT